MKRIAFILCIISVAIFSDSNAQRKKKNNNNSTPNLDIDNYQGLKWRNIGPFRGGRSNAIAGGAR